MSVNIESTTDSKEQVLAAIGGAKPNPVEESKSVSSKDEQSKQDETSDESEVSQEIEESDVEESDEDEQSEDNEESKEQSKPKKKSGFKRKIGKLQKEIEQLRAEKAALSGAGKLQEQAVSNPEQQTKSEVAGKPDPATFDSHEEYVEALTDWKIEEKERVKEAKAKEAQEKTEYQQQIDSHLTKVSEFKKSTPDFDDVISDVDDIPLSHTIQSAILSSDCGPELMYELSKNREQLEKLVSMSPTAAAREIGKIEARLSNGAQQKQPESKPITKAPAPVNPISKSSSVKVQKNPDDMDYKEYKAWRAEQKGK